LETFLEAILLKPFQLFSRILNDVSSVTKTVFSALISVQGAVKDQLDPGQESMGDAPVFSHCCLLRNLAPKPTVVLEHCYKGETAPWFSIFPTFPSDRVAKVTKFFTVAIPVNYASEFRELFKFAT
jgi:hypothetical protein